MNSSNIYTNLVNSEFCETSFNNTLLQNIRIVRVILESQSPQMDSVSEIAPVPEDVTAHGCLWISWTYDWVSCAANTRDNQTFYTTSLTFASCPALKQIDLGQKWPSIAEVSVLGNSQDW